MTGTQISAEPMFAIWNRVFFIPVTPAINGTKARTGPMNRHRKIEATPYRRKNSRARATAVRRRRIQETRHAAGPTRRPSA